MCKMLILEDYWRAIRSNKYRFLRICSLMTPGGCFTKSEYFKVDSSDCLKCFFHLNGSHFLFREQVAYKISFDFKHDKTSSWWRKPIFKELISNFYLTFKQRSLFVQNLDENERSRSYALATDQRVPSFQMPRNLSLDESSSDRSSHSLVLWETSDDVTTQGCQNAVCVLSLLGVKCPNMAWDFLTLVNKKD